ncbi:MAG TPA: substrate-binding domain-containing protein [Feifaniaceae bacterium]|nr:substrate-binding domain-containing protein [Feifaniaceae bacterium]
MKKAISVILCVLFLLALAAGCTKVTPGTPTTADTPKTADTPRADATVEAPTEDAQPAAIGEPMTIRFFAGGEAGDAFASIVYKGAMDAAAMLKPYNVSVEYVFSGWEPEKMISQLREAIAARPDAICMMGHPGDDAIMPLAEEASKAGIIMVYQNVNVPEVRKQYGGGYVGVVDQAEQGKALAQAAINTYGLKAGDRAVVFGSWGQPGRYFREEGMAVTLESIGMKIERVVTPNEAAADPQLLLPLISGQLQSNPETKMIVYGGGQQLSAAKTYMEACGKKPGEVINIGFDLSPAILDGFKEGYIQLTADQQPYLQGFVPVMSAYLTKNFQLSGIVLDTGAGLIDKNNFEAVADLVAKGIR